jgi:hypothetical protein
VFPPVELALTVRSTPSNAMDPNTKRTQTIRLLSARYSHAEPSVIDIVVDLLERSDVKHQTGQSLEEWVEEFLENTPLPTVIQNPSEAIHVSEVAILDSTDASQYLSPSADSPKVESFEELLAASPVP